MKLGLFIANLELLAQEHGRNVEVTGALADEGLMPSPEVEVSANLFAIHPGTEQNPVFLVIALCPHCGRPASEHGH